MKPFFIKLAKENDVDYLIEMAYELQSNLEKCNPSIWPFSLKAKDYFKKRILELLSNPDAQVILAKNNKGEAMGMAVGKINRHPHHIPKISGTIEQLIVREEYRGQGIARKLIQVLCKFFSSQEAEDISIKYVIGDKVAEEFWKYFGFQPVITTAGIKQKKLLEKISISEKEKNNKSNP